MTNTMTLRQAQLICSEIDRNFYFYNRVKWTDVFKDEKELLQALSEIYIPKGRTAPPYTFKGYAYIYSFAYYVQKGWTLSTKQITQCKRLALEIKKAKEISAYRF